jgi:hypothetical protein
VKPVAPITFAPLIVVLLAPPGLPAFGVNDRVERLAAAGPLRPGEGLGIERVAE